MTKMTRSNILRIRKLKTEKGWERVKNLNFSGRVAPRAQKYENQNHDLIKRVSLESWWMKCVMWTTLLSKERERERDTSTRLFCLVVNSLENFKIAPWTLKDSVELVDKRHDIQPAAFVQIYDLVFTLALKWNKLTSSLFLITRRDFFLSIARQRNKCDRWSKITNFCIFAAHSK